MNPAKLKPYIEADKLRLERRNYEMWLQGVYFFDAVSIALANAFAGKRKRPIEYPEKPRKITRDTPEEKAARVEQERKKAVMFFKNMENRFREKRGEIDGNN